MLLQMALFLSFLWLNSISLRVCVRACVRACVCACMCVNVYVGSFRF